MMQAAMQSFNEILFDLSTKYISWSAFTKSEPTQKN
jgi:hypothetical protein